MITTPIFITIIIILLGELSKCFDLLIPMLKGGGFNNLSHKVFREELGRANRYKEKETEVLITENT